MLIHLREIRGYDLMATDGSIGSVRDVYFDDRFWVIRYLVVDTGKWLPGRKVLISPQALGEPDRVETGVPVSLSKEQIKASPDIGTELPVSRQHEVELHEYYGWPFYWEFYPTPTGAAPVVPPFEPRAGLNRTEHVEQKGDPNLRSAREVKNYHIAAKDGEIGHVDDFVIDVTNWSVRYLVVDTRNWLPGRKVLVAPDWVEEIDWAEARVHVNLDREGVKHSPAYDDTAAVSREYETALHEHYGRRGYWL